MSALGGISGGPTMPTTPSSSSKVMDTHEDSGRSDRFDSTGGAESSAGTGPTASGADTVDIASLLGGEGTDTAMNPTPDDGVSSYSVDGGVDDRDDGGIDAMV